MKYEYLDDMPIDAVASWPTVTDDGPGYDWHTIRLTRSTLMSMEPANILDQSPDVEDGSLTPVSSQDEIKWPDDLRIELEVAIECLIKKTVKVSTRNGVWMECEGEEYPLNVDEDEIDNHLINNEYIDWDKIAQEAIAEYNLC